MEMGRWGDGRVWGPVSVGSVGSVESMGRWGDGEMGRWGDGEMKLMCSVVSAKNWYYISWPRFRDYLINIAFLIVIRYR
uniref:Uncharacterized protein n=1 Tax=Moorena producens (strain JHB) TaxID=1454205 RepID=A0A1D9G8I7_MOOP1